MLDEDQLEERHNAALEKQHTKFRSTTIKINDDIYSLAFAALINPEELQYDDFLDDKEKLEKYLQKNLTLTRRERSRLYQSALMVVFIQITTIYLLIMYFKKTSDPPVTVNAPKHYLILIPRLLSSFMMHLTVEQDIRNRLLLMKYAVNHPFLFKANIHQPDQIQGEKTKNTAMTRRTCFAFLLGFF